ncbi:HTH domain-containing protein, partial [Vibrio parahaemolyticus]
TKNIDDAEGLISVYNSNRKLDKISKFLEKNSDLIPQSTQLQIHLAWDYYRKGDVHECREVLSKYFPQNEGSRYLVDELEDSLNLCTGDWDALAKNIELAWENRDSLTAKELFRKSSLAEAVLPNRARKFVIEAVSKEPNNPDILTAGYSVATNLGLDEKEEVIEWLRKAISISGDSGPIKKISLEEIGEVLLSNREAPNKAWELFLSGEVPTTLAAANLNRSISSFIITPWIINTNELEVNKKLLIPAYSLKREIIDILPEVIALELTAILSLSNIGLLELTITSFKKVIIAHSTLLSIFNDRKKTAFHQPSQIELAKCIIEETKKFSVFKYDSVRDIEFRSKINDESAEFISHAMEENIDLVRLVCISEPVYVANSLMKEEFDLAPYRHCLVSIGRIIRFLYECGMIMLVEAKEKLEKIDPGACIDNIRCDIKPGSELYIDRLSCHKLHKLGLLSLLGDSSLQCYISEMHDNENKKL